MCGRICWRGTLRHPCWEVEVAALSVGCCSGFSTGFEGALVVGVFAQVESICRPAGQECSVGGLVELFRWRGGFRDEYVPTAPCVHGCATISIRL